MPFRPPLHLGLLSLVDANLSSPPLFFVENISGGRFFFVGGVWWDGGVDYIFDMVVRGENGGMGTRITNMGDRVGPSIE